MSEQGPYIIRRLVPMDEPLTVGDPRVELCTISEVAELVGISVVSASRAIGERLTEVIDLSASSRSGRRLALRSEVARWLEERGEPIQIPGA